MSILTTLTIYSLLLGVTLMCLWLTWRLSRLSKVASPTRNRAILLSMVAFSIVAATVPFFAKQSQILKATPAAQSISLEIGDVADIQFMEDEPFAWTFGLDEMTYIYASGLIISSLCLLGTLLYIATVISRSCPTTDKNVRTKRGLRVPFSWIKWIIIPEDKETTPEEAAILCHERAHIRSAHWVDLLILRIVGCITWYLPAAYLIRRDLIDCHEYAADNAVLASGFNKEQYQMLLITVASQRHFKSSIVNSFKYSSIKNRIDMMQKSKTPAKRVWIRAFAIPSVAIAMLAVLSSPTVASTVKNLTPDKSHEAVEKQLSAEAVEVTDSVVTATKTVTEIAVSMNEDEDTKIYSTPAKLPEFQGGQSGLFSWLNSNIRYPKDAYDENIQGRVVVQFVVEKDGSVSNAKVVRGVCESLDAEALRVIKSLPKFTPGEMDGKPVRVWYSLPITFKLSGDIAAPKKEESIEDKIFTVPEKMPEFNGGSGEMFKWIKENLRYPKDAYDENIQGRVIVQFVIEKDGSIGDVNVNRGVCESLDAEAVRVIKTLPNFTPGKMNGQPVRTWLTLPITFKIYEPEQTDTKTE